MAKSIRSKHKRKMRKVKRQFYAKKELERLQKIAANADKELSELVTMKSAQEMKDAQTASLSNVAADDSKMEIDSSKAKVYDKKTKQDENGHYPPWMHQRAVKKHKQKLVKQKMGKKIGKKIKW